VPLDPTPKGLNVDEVDDVRGCWTLSDGLIDTKHFCPSPWTTNTVSDTGSGVRGVRKKSMLLAGAVVCCVLGLTACVASIPTAGLDNVAGELHIKTMGITAWSRVYETSGEASEPALELYVTGTSSYTKIRERLKAAGFQDGQGNRWFRISKEFGFQLVQVRRAEAGKSTLRNVGSTQITHWTPPKDGIVVDILSSGS
jgi:hypothetical protein